MRKLKPPKLFYLSVVTLVMVVIWIVTSVLRVLLAKPEYDVPKEILKPINPSLDTQTLGKIEQRLYFDESQMPESLAIPESAKVINE